MTDSTLIGVKALLRWENPTLGIGSPEEFIPIWETNGFISELGQFVLHQAARDALVFADDVVMAVNVSSIQLEQTDRLCEGVETSQHVEILLQEGCLEDKAITTEGRGPAPRC